MENETANQQNTGTDQGKTPESPENTNQQQTDKQEIKDIKLSQEKENKAQLPKENAQTTKEETNETQNESKGNKIKDVKEKQQVIDENNENREIEEEEEQQKEVKDKTQKEAEKNKDKIKRQGIEDIPALIEKIDLSDFDASNVEYRKYNNI